MGDQPAREHSHAMLNVCRHVCACKYKVKMTCGCLYVHVQGEEVMNTYGQHSNASLLHMYGFTEEDNAYTEVLSCVMFGCDCDVVLRL